MLLHTLQDLAKGGVACLLTEQNAVLALEVCTRGYILESGRITIQGSAESLRSNEAVRRAFLSL